MQSRIRWYVAIVAAAASGCFGILYLTSPKPPADIAFHVALLAALAFVGELLRIALPRSAQSSTAGVPYLALTLIVPAWPSVAAAAIVKTLAELWVRRGREQWIMKAVLNISAFVLMEWVAVSAYTALGGRSLLGISDGNHLSHVTRVAGGPAFISTSLALFTNTVLVYAAIAISSGRSIRSILVDNHRQMIGADILASPLIFIFAWTYAQFGAIAAATLFIPILGLRQLQQTNLELEKTNQELLELMVKSLEARDAYTSGHSRRVHQYSTIIARAIGLTERQVEQVGRAALLHDVGKIHEKYAPILSKMDKLTPEEWHLMKQHPEDGAQLIATMSKLHDVVPAVRHHHENWDGTGYPHGLAGELIPLASRIIRFADTIDAMTTDRPYRRPLGEAEVRSEIVRCRGTQFDPSMADALLSSQLWFTLFPPDASSANPDIKPRKTPTLREVLKVVG